MSPEGLRGEEMTTASDQYSLGVVMYECVTGANPFGANTFAEIFRLIGAGEYPAPSNARPQISKRLERIIMRAMNLDPSQRFKDLREMGRELLMLAGQRTRITWSLSFGEIERPKASGINTWKVPERTSSSAPPEGADRRRRKLALLSLPLSLLAVLLIVALSGAISTPPNAPNKPPVQAAVAPPPAVQTAAGASMPAEATPPPLPRRKSDAPVAPQAAHRLGTHHAHSLAGVQTIKSDDSDPDWAIPTASTTTQVKPGQGRVQVGLGANGAPIFD
jgi:serine/threonine protein kinase